MEKSSSQTALKVVSIIMIVFSAIGLLVGLFALFGGGLVVAGSQSALGTGIGATIAVAGFAAILGSAFSLVVAIFGLRAADDTSKIGVFFVLAIISAVLAIISVITTIVINGNVLVSILGLVLPVICVVLAYNIKNENARRLS